MAASLTPPSHRPVLIRIVFALAAVVGVPAFAEQPAIEFNRDVRPLFSDRCFKCHGPDSGSREAELRLDRRESATESVIIPGDSASSELISRITTDDPELRMPPEKAHKPLITKSEAAILARWIDEGAKYEPHWAYIPPRRPAIPKTKEADWPRGDLDRLILARQECAGVSPAPEADPRILIRRLYFDLVGLPPAPAQIDEFLADRDPGAYERVVDKLLASPHFGERLATWWFDLVRFSDTVGYHGDQNQNIAPYRDYVIKAFNDNLPFDQFTIEQLAGDLLPNPTLWQQVATGYNRILQSTHEGGAQDLEYRAIMQADRVRNFSEVWLASSVGCAQCHDHKFDPFTQRDFYSLAAFFADVDHYGSFQGVAPDREVTRRPPEILAWTIPVYEELQTLDRRIAEVEAKLAPELPKDYEAIQRELTELKRRRVDVEGRFVPTMVTQAVEPRQIRILARGNWMDDTGEIVQPAVPSFLPAIAVEGRRPTRLDLARWVVDPANPLAARVVVNRLWKLYFGRGIAKSMIDVGSQSDWPVDQELLDWLAVEFVERDWDLKHMVRIIVTSSAYRQSSDERPEVDRTDPDNALFARQGRHRLDAEQIRDAALLVSGLLVDRLGGRDYSRPYQPEGYYAQLNFPERTYKPSSDDNQYRRGVYIHWQRQFLHPFLAAFDAPSREECTAARPQSNTPSAALVLLNDPSMVEAARALAARVVKQAVADEAARIRWAWLEVLGREPTSEEVVVIEKLLADSRRDVAADAESAKKLVAVGQSSPPDAAQVAEAAAWTSVCRTLLNLNETITRN